MKFKEVVLYKLLTHGILVMLTLIPMMGFSQVFYEEPYKETVIIPDCEVNKSCSLKQYSIQVQDYKILFTGGKVSFGTRMFAEFETENLETLEDYAIVQTVKGCQFQSKKSVSGVEYLYIYVRELFDDIVPFIHKTWQIDSVDRDPVYNNTPVEFKETWKTRLGLYRWNRVANSYHQDTEVLYYKEKPQTPKLYVVDRPGTAFYENGVAKNISLQFKACLYKASDVPEVGHPDEIGFASPLHCFDWASSFIYDHNRDLFIKSEQIHSACL